VVREPPASFGHGRLAAGILTRLSAFVKEHELGEVVSTETGFLLARDPDTVRAPDVAFVSRETLERVGDVRGFFPGPPDLAIEVRSPSERPAEVHAKIADYLAAGTRLVWVVDAGPRSVVVYRALLSPRTLLGHDVLDGEEILPGFRLPIAELFP
jgi:Uma2 family endonuclease